MDHTFGRMEHNVNRHQLSRFTGTLALIAFLMALAACGTDPVSTPTPTSPPPLATLEATSPTATPTSTPTPTPTPTPSPTPSPEPTPTPAAAPEAQEPEGPALPASVEDAHGNEVVVEDISRIVVLNGDFTEVVFALGLGQNVVAVDISATYPSEALRLPKIGYQRALSAEGILAMEPTLVLGSTSAGPAEVIEQIRSAGVAVVILEPTNTLDGVTKKIRGIAQALGVAERP